MGVSYYSQRALWWHGPNNSGTLQDDLSKLSGSSNNFGYRPDDHGGAWGDASSLSLSGTAASAAGVIERMTDVDSFLFTTSGGTVSFTAAVAQFGAMLDLSLTLLDSNGNVVASAATSSLGESLSANLAAGTYRLAVSSAGNYGDIGQYTITGTVPNGGGGTPAPVASAGGPYSVNEGGSVALSGAGSTGTGLTYAWDLDGDGVYGETGSGATRGNETGATPTFSAAGLDGAATRTVSLRVTDNEGRTSTQSATISALNVAPTLTIGGANSVNEGSTYTLTLTATDPGPDTISSWLINWGDGSTQTVTGNPSSVTHAYADHGSYTVSATATDEDGTHTANTKAITVANVAPTITITGNNSVNEGSSYSLTLGAVTDAGSDAVTEWIVDWGDGTTNTYTSGGVKTHTYADGLASRAIAIRLKDEDGTHNAASKTVTVNNVAPTLSVTGASAVAEGSTYTLNLSATDPGSDTVSQWTINWGDGNVQVVGGGTTSVTHTYADHGSRTISVTAADDDGTYTAASKAVTVTNVAPTLTVTGNNSVNEGSVYSLTLGSITDPGADTVSQWVVVWGDGTTDTYTSGGVKTHTYADGSIVRNATIRLVDEDGTHTVATKTITVNNVAPTLTIGGANSANEGSSYTLTLSASDPGADTIGSWLINWGDGTTQTVIGNPSSVAHTYADNGAYTITATATDEDGTHSATSKAVTVANVAPALSIVGNATAAVGAPYTLSLASSDPGADTVSQWAINWGDGTVETVSGDPSSATHAYADTGSYTISATATDEDGTYAAASTRTVSVTSQDLVAPTVAATSAFSPITSAGDGTYTFTVTYGDDVAVMRASLNDKDVLVTGPNGFSQLASVVAVSEAADAASITVTYRVTCAGGGGSWSGYHNGTYTVATQRYQVYDSSANPMEAATLGSFTVDLPDTAPPDPAGDDRSSARRLNTVKVGTIKTAREWVGVSDDIQDYFRFDLKQAALVTLKLYDLQADANLHLRGADNHLIRASGREGTRYDLVSMNLAPGTYYARVIGNSPSTTYTFRLSATAPTGPAAARPRLATGTARLTAAVLPFNTKYAIRPEAAEALQRRAG